jgi:flagellar P-ring protein precursor FlgI
MRRTLPLALCLTLLAGGLSAAAGDGAATTAGSTVRVKDIASLQGVMSTPLIGYGIVAGLAKTGDRRQTIFSAQTLANMLERFGVLVPGQQINIQNIAAVLVTAEMPAFVRKGGRIDVSVASVGDAQSLQGGTLLATALRGPDGSVYALAQGPLSIGGFGGKGGGTSVTVNHLTAGRVPNGALVENAPQSEAPTQAQDQVMLVLHQPDFTSANRLADAINADLGPGSAAAVDAGSVTIKVPSMYKASLPSLMARLEPLPVTVDAPARVVINERTGTVVIGSNVRLGAAAVAHGNLSVKISTKYNVSQPTPFSQGGQTTVTPETKIDVSEGDQKLIALQEGTTLESVISALNALGASPRDIIAIVQALNAAGALSAEIVIL